ncbi:MAG: hypothetical protein ABRQ39_06130 [Candidatus Eremiobacterota bacterium]
MSTLKVPASPVLENRSLIVFKDSIWEQLFPTFRRNNEGTVISKILKVFEKFSCLIPDTSIRKF